MKIDSEAAKEIIKKIAAEQWPSEKIRCVEIMGKIHIVNVKRGFQIIGYVPIDGDGMVNINKHSKWIPR